MLFNSLAFLVFVPVVTLIFFLLPHRLRWAHLLAASCFFYAAFVPAYLLILAFTTRFLPIGYVNANAAIRSLNPEMEEAVRVLGGSRLLAMRKVVGPLLKRSLLGAWLLMFIPATRELSSAIFLYGPSTKVVSVMIFDMSDEGNFEYLAALALILQALTLPLLWIGQRAIGRDFMLRRSAT